ncbi:glutathione S-transferase [Hydrocarboniphaga daqingensis]|uniref:Glutathione S-transferase n=1 Tax=Hydrocarboniphaga daqingensis TaxID=490188 RepID=A0A1M5RVS1_9GAMM|nr:glutathione S-transferase family protein [Hydrocarboniphaga daqingensis]SHH30290.1 glutathione S-transferase [Hydrocarboniphaga daqingensis]
MKMKLYSSPTSPYARKVRVVAAELGLTDLIDEIQVDPHGSPPELLSINPLSKIPVLVTERGEALPDSGLIVEYLLTRGRGVTALPRGSKRWAALRREKIADGIIDAAVATVMEKRRPESIVYTVFLDRQAALIERALDLLNQETADFEPEAPSIVEITIGVALGYLDLRMPYIEWRRGREPLASWYTAFAQRAAMVRSQPPVV